MLNSRHTFLKVCDSELGDTMSNNISLIKEAAVKYNDPELLRLAQEIEKEAGLREGVAGLVEAVAPKAAVNLNKPVSDVAKEGISNLVSKLKPAPKVTNIIKPRPALRTASGALIQNYMPARPAR